MLPAPQITQVTDRLKTLNEENRKKPTILSKCYKYFSSDKKKTRSKDSFPRCYYVPKDPVKVILMYNSWNELEEPLNTDLVVKVSSEIYLYMVVSTNKNYLNIDDDDDNKLLQVNLLSSQFSVLPRQEHDHKNILYFKATGHNFSNEQTEVLEVYVAFESVDIARDFCLGIKSFMKDNRPMVTTGASQQASRNNSFSSKLKNPADPPAELAPIEPIVEFEAPSPQVFTTQATPTAAEAPAPSREQQTMTSGTHVEIIEEFSTMNARVKELQAGLMMAIASRFPKAKASHSDSAVLKVMELRDLRKNLTPEYPFGGPTRVSIPDDKIEWREFWAEYSPPDFTTGSILQGDMDKELRLTDVGLWPKWNQQNGGVNRRSHHGNYKTGADGYPLNPAGRTGLKGRGCLGRWAANHVADCLITRWKKSEDGTIVMRDGRRVLQFIGIIRKDTGDAAFPGGMIDSGEDAMTAVQRVFLEEVFSVEDATDEERVTLEDSLKSVFASGDSVYRGYVDDRRNTDNAWIETEAINFSLDEDENDVFRNLKFKAGSDAKGALWIDVDQNVKLYASHKTIIQILVQKLDAYW